MTVIEGAGADAPEGTRVPGQGAADRDGAPVRRVLDYDGAIALLQRETERAQADGTFGAFAERALESCLDLVGALFVDTARDMQVLRERMETEAGAPLQAGKMARDLRSGAELLIEERNRLEKLRKEAARGVGGAGGALDLVAARDEIGRRLACLRRAGGD